MTTPKTFAEVDAQARRLKADLLRNAVEQSDCIGQAAYMLGIDRNSFTAACNRLGVDYSSIRDNRGAKSNPDRDRVMWHMKQRGETLSTIGYHFDLTPGGVRNAIKRVAG